MTDNRGSAKKIIPVLFVGTAILYAVGIPAAVAFSLYDSLPLHKNVQEFAAAFSDLISPIFSVLAFIGLALATFFQYQELQETKAELQRTADAQTAQAQLNALSALLNSINGDLDYQSNRGNTGNVGILLERRKKIEDEIKAVLKQLKVHTEADKSGVEGA